MSTNSQIITINDIEVQVVRKNIKNLHLGVYPPNGHVRVAVPQFITDENVRLAVITKLAWIKKQQANFEKQPRQSQRKMIFGESHYYFGRRYLLDVIERQGKHEVILRNNTIMDLFVRPGTTHKNRSLVLSEWYRDQLKKIIPNLIEKWQPIIGVHVNEWGVKKMKTKWGACNTSDGRVWLNLELAKKPAECLEYILVHEMVHLLERSHNDTFRAYMDKFMPQWSLHRKILNSVPLAHEEWTY